MQNTSRSNMSSETWVSITPSNQNIQKQEKNSEIVSKHVINTTDPSFSLLYASAFCSGVYHSWQSTVGHPAGFTNERRTPFTSAHNHKSIRHDCEREEIDTELKWICLRHHTPVQTGITEPHHYTDATKDPAFWRQTLHKRFHNTWIFILDNQDHENESATA